MIIIFFEEDLINIKIDCLDVGYICFLGDMLMWIGYYEFVYVG